MSAGGGRRLHRRHRHDHGRGPRLHNRFGGPDFDRSGSCHLDRCHHSGAARAGDDHRGPELSRRCGDPCRRVLGARPRAKHHLDLGRQRRGARGAGDATRRRGGGARPGVRGGRRVGVRRRGHGPGPDRRRALGDGRGATPDRRGGEDRLGLRVRPGLGGRRSGRRPQHPR